MRRRREPGRHCLRTSHRNDDRMSPAGRRPGGRCSDPLLELCQLRPHRRLVARPAAGSTGTTSHDTTSRSSSGPSNNSPCWWTATTGAAARAGGAAGGDHARALTPGRPRSPRPRATRCRARSPSPSVEKSVEPPKRSPVGLRGCGDVVADAGVVEERVVRRREGEVWWRRWAASSAASAAGRWRSPECRVLRRRPAPPPSLRSDRPRKERSVERRGCSQPPLARGQQPPHHAAAEAEANGADASARQPGL